MRKNPWAVGLILLACLTFGIGFLSHFSGKNKTVNIQIELPPETVLIKSVVLAFDLDNKHLLDSFKYVTLIKSEDQSGKLTSYIVFTNLEPKKFEESPKPAEGSTVQYQYLIEFPEPNLAFMILNNRNAYHLTHKMTKLYLSDTSNLTQTTLELSDIFQKQ